jgi:hypothetical protein
MWATTQAIHTPTGIGTGVKPLRTSAPPRTSAIPHAIPTMRAPDLLPKPANISLRAWEYRPDTDGSSLSANIPRNRS